jgi:hypothetical protein
MPTKLHCVTFEKTVVFRRRDNGTKCVISGFRNKVDKNCLLSYYAASSSNFLSMFRDNLSVPSSRAKMGTISLKIGPVSCPETSIRIYYYSLCNNPEESSSQLKRNTVTWTSVTKEVTTEFKGSFFCTNQKTNGWKFKRWLQCWNRFQYN